MPSEKTDPSSTPGEPSRQDSSPAAGGKPAGQPETRAAKPPAATENKRGDGARRWVSRLDIHQRIQHACVMVSFLGLAITGWPMRAPESQTSRELAMALGGPVAVGTAHRCFGALLLFASLYHLIYLVVLLRRRRLVLSMLPGLRDLRELTDNLLHRIGLRSQPPRFGRYTYWEKFDYWAVFWGMAIIGISGVILWFPILAVRILPPWSLGFAHMVHGEEALLALLAIFVWHFYNGHFRPTTFPVNWVFLTGRLPEEMVREEYGGWWQELQAEGGTATSVQEEPRPLAPEAEKRWRRVSLIVTGSLTLVLLVGIGAWAALGTGLHHLDGGGPLPRHLRSGSLAPPTNASVSTVPSRVAPGNLATLAGIPLGSVKEVMALSCFKSCHTQERYQEEFPHEAHANNGLGCVDCHSYKAHRTSEIKEAACAECH